MIDTIDLLLMVLITVGMLIMIIALPFLISLRLVDGVTQLSSNMLGMPHSVVSIQD